MDLKNYLKPRRNGKRPLESALTRTPSAGEHAREVDSTDIVEDVMAITTMIPMRISARGATRDTYQEIACLRCRHARDAVALEHNLTHHRTVGKAGLNVNTQDRPPFVLISRLKQA